MDEMQLKGAGMALAQARRKRVQIDAPWPEPPRSLEEAYEVQRAAVAALDRPLAGWKIGATGKDHQARLRTDRPFFGPIPQEDVLAAGVALPFRPGLRGVECEIAFHLGRDLPRRAAPYGREEIRAAVASLHPALELVGTRIAGDGLPDARIAVADFGLNVAFLPGPALEGWEALDLAAVEARCLVNGEEKAAGTGALVLGDPWAALAWLADNGPGLLAGQWISSGTLTGITPLAPGAAATGIFGPLGQVSLRLEG